MAMEGRVRELLDEIKYQRRFPPRGAAEIAKNELALQGRGRSGALVQRVCGIYLESVEEVLEAFSETVLDKAVALGLSGDAEIRAVLATAHEQLFNEARGLVLDELGGLMGEYRTLAFAIVDGRRDEVWQHLERTSRLRALREWPSKSGKETGRKFTVFLSHAAVDAQISKLLKREIERRIPGVWVFSSSDPSDLPPGTKWPTEIQRILKEADIYVLLATSRSLRRPWVWFEAGTGWFTGRRLMPLCLGPVRKGALPPPLGEWQALNVDEAEDLGLLFSEIAKAAGLEFTDTELGVLIGELLVLEENAAAIVAERIAGWSGVEWTDRFLCYEGPVESLRLIEDVPFQESMAEVLKEAEYLVRLARPDNLGRYADEGYRLIYLTDRRSWRRKSVHGDTVLIARPLRWELQVSPDGQGNLTVENRTIRLDRGAFAVYQGADANQKRRFRRHALASPKQEYAEQAIREIIR
jgi:hypothetical protein